MERKRGRGCGAQGNWWKEEKAESIKSSFVDEKLV